MVRPRSISFVLQQTTAVLAMLLYFHTAAWTQSSSLPHWSGAWEAKYRANLELAAQDRLPDPISRCGTPAGFPRLLALPNGYDFIVRPEQT
jgi:hypothetical protein